MEIQVQHLEMVIVMMKPTMKTAIMMGETAVYPVQTQISVLIVHVLLLVSSPHLDILETTLMIWMCLGTFKCPVEN